MEVKESASTTSGGVTVVGSDAPSEFHVAPRTQNPAQQAPGSAPQPPPPAAVPQPPPQGAVEPPPHAAAGMMGMIRMKKKRGRPRKYGPDGSVAMPLSPKPISSSAPPPVIDFSMHKRGKVKPVGSVIKPSFEVENLAFFKSRDFIKRLNLKGDWVQCSVGANFTPHIITVNTGEDVTMKIISFSQQGPRAICILSANGVISSVTLRQPDSSGGTLTYEGRFEILSLSGSFMPNDTGGTRSRSGGMSVSLAGPDGRIVGGGVAGLLVAASPVQVVVGSFLAGSQHEQKPKKQKQEINVISMATPTAAIPISSAEPKSTLLSSPSFRGENWSSLAPDSRNRPTDINISIP